MLFLLTEFTHKLKLEKIHGTLIILFYVSSRSPQLQRFSFSIKKTQKRTAAMDLQHLKVEVTDKIFRTLPMLKIEFSNI